MESRNQRLGTLFVALGIGAVLSGLLVNPWLGWLYRHDVIDFRDAMLDSFVSAIAIGLLIAGLGWTLRVARWRNVEGPVLRLVTCASLVRFDRLLLARLELPSWISDTELHYRQRPGAIRSWGIPSDAGSSGSIGTDSTTPIFRWRSAATSSERSCSATR